MLCKEIKRKQYKATKLGCLLHGIALAHTTKVGCMTLEKVIALSNAAFLANIGCPKYMVFNAVELSPLALTLKKLMLQLDTDIVLLPSHKIRNKKLSLMADKGEDKGNSSSFVKLLSWYEEGEGVTNGVNVICFGIEIAGNTSKAAALGVDHALKLYEYSDDNDDIQPKMHSSQP